MTAPTVEPDYRDPAVGRRLPPLTPPTNGRQPGSDNGGGSRPQPSVDPQQARAIAYAAVTAHLLRNDEQVARYVHELLQDPVDAASGLLALVQACRGMAERWGGAAAEDPVSLWLSFQEDRRPYPSAA